MLFFLFDSCRYFKTILFTMDENILESMAQYDQTYEVDEEEDDVLMRSYNFERPSTADQGDRGVCKLLHLKQDRDAVATIKHS